jgi:hypothetical protein
MMIYPVRFANQGSSFFRQPPHPPGGKPISPEFVAGQPPEQLEDQAHHHQQSASWLRQAGFPEQDALDQEATARTLDHYAEQARQKK